MENQRIFGEFERGIAKKYGHIGYVMRGYFADLQEYLDENGIPLEEFDKSNLNEFVDENLSYGNMNEAECCILFQMLIDFCRFCKEKGIDLQTLEKYLLNNKKKLFDNWISEEFDNDFLDDNLKGSNPEVFNPKELLENFDAYYALMRLSRKGNKMELDKVIDFLKKTRELMKISYETSMNIREKNPNLPEEKYLSLIDEEIEKHEKNIFKGVPKPEEFFEMVSQLPKESAKKILELSFKMNDTINYKFGSLQRREVLEELLRNLEDIIKDLEKQMRGGN